MTTPSVLMSDHERPAEAAPVAEQIRKGLEEAIRHTKDEITLKTTTLELHDPPPEVRPDELIEIACLMVLQAVRRDLQLLLSFPPTPLAYHVVANAAGAAQGRDRVWGL